MTAAGATAWQAGGIGLLDRAIRYAVDAAGEVTPELLTHPTPCRGWDLEMLLRHANESLNALREGIDTGYLGLIPDAPEGELPLGIAETFRCRARWLLDAWTSAGDHRLAVDIAGCLLPATLMAKAGALEIAVHGWDISQACGHCRPIPQRLATGLLAIAPLLVPEAGRHPLFAAPVPAAPGATPGDQLAAFLGRCPRTDNSNTCCPPVGSLES
jgi:uncharacterized protein (TIGR03086 family)